MSELTPSEKKAIEALTLYLNENLSQRVKSIALFGSKARGDSTKDSDIDILIVLDKDDRELRRAISTQAARISLEYDVLLSPRVIGQERWQKMRGFSLYRNVIQEASSLSLEQGNLVFGSAKKALSVGA